MKKRPAGSWLAFFQVSYQPWVYFCFFLFSNSLLSYFPLSLPAKLLIGVLGLVLPLGLAFWTVLEKRLKKNPDGTSVTPSQPGRSWNVNPPFGLWILFVFLLLFTRFYRLTSIPFWPISDEGSYCFLGWGMSKHWSWDLLWGGAQFEPLIIWILGLYFKVVQPSLLAIRFLPAVISIMTALISYWAVRPFFAKSPSFLFSLLLAFSFWDLTLSRLYLQVILITLFQLAALGFLGRFLWAPNVLSKPIYFCAVSITAGLGFYAWATWLPIWIWLTLILAHRCWRGKKEDRWYLMAFVSSTILAALPLVLVRLSPGGSAHIKQILNLSDWRPLFSYMECLFWNGLPAFPFGSNWGGLLNPILLSLAFLGIVEYFRCASWNFLGAVTALALLCFLPGALTNDLEIHRVFIFLPLLTWMAVPGIQSLFPNPLKSVAKTGITLLLLSSFSLDAYNFLIPYSDTHYSPPDRQWRNIQYYDAYKTLEKLSQQQGCLYIFSEFNTDYDNKILDLTDYPFNASENSSLEKSNPSWTCVIANVFYAPYFTKISQGLRWQVLKTDRTGPWDPKPFALFILPTSQIPASMLEGWKKADNLYRELDFEIKNKSPIRRWASFMEADPSLCGQFSKDPFLTAVYWEKMGFYKYLDGWFIQATQDYRNAIQLGIPAAHLYYDLGVCLKIQNRSAESQKCFEKATALSEGKCQ